jgi:hypothetical protein
MRFTFCIAVLLLVGPMKGAAAVPPPGKVRVICAESWKTELFESNHLPDKIPGLYFDVILPLADIPPDTMARDVEGLAARRAGRRGPNDWTQRVYVLRWSEGRKRFITIERSGLFKASKQLISDLQDGDILVFFGGLEYFGRLKVQRPGHAGQRTPKAFGVADLVSC